MKSLIEHTKLMAMIYDIDDNKLKEFGYKSLSIIQNNKDGWEPRMTLIDEDDQEFNFNGEEAIVSKIEELHSKLS